MKKLVFKNKKQETSQTWSFIFDPVEDFDWVPGQFLVYQLETGSSEEMERYFTIASAPSEEEVRLTTRIYEKRSDFKDELFSMEKGDVIKAEGPDGEFVVEDENSPHVFMAGGVGITPFRAMLIDFDEKAEMIDSHLLYGNGSQEFVFKDLLDGLKEDYEQFNVDYIVSPEKIGESDFERMESKMDSPVYYISGPAPMVDSLGKTALDLGIEEERIKHDHFPGYEWEW